MFCCSSPDSDDERFRVKKTSHLSPYDTSRNSSLSNANLVIAHELTRLTKKDKAYLEEILAQQTELCFVISRLVDTGNVIHRESSARSFTMDNNNNNNNYSTTSAITTHTSFGGGGGGGLPSSRSKNHVIPSIGDRGTALVVSKRMCEFTQFSEEEVVGLTIEALQEKLCRGHVNRVKKLLGNSAALSDANLSLVCFKKDNTPFMNEVTMQTLLTKEGRAALLVSQSEVMLLSLEEAEKVAPSLE